MATYEELLKQGAKPLGEKASYEELVSSGAKSISGVGTTASPTGPTNKSFLEKVGDIAGITPLSKGLSTAIFRTTKEYQDLKKLAESGQITPEEFISISTGGLQKEVTPEAEKALTKKILSSGAATAMTALSGGSLKAGGAAMRIPAVAKAVDAVAKVASIGEKTRTGRIATAGLLGATRGGLDAYGENKTTGEIVSNSVKTGLLSMAISGAIEGVGKLKEEIFKKLPEKVYSSFLKETKDDISKVFKPEAIEELKVKYPDSYQELLDKGIIKEVGGRVSVVKDKAQFALENGLWGTPEKMAKTSYLKQLESESKLKDILAGKTLSPSNKKGYIQLFDELSEEYKKSGAGFLRAKQTEANRLSRAFSQDTIEADVVLDARRFLDDVRRESSFRANPNLSPKEETYKVAADKLRKEIGKIEGSRTLMSEYSNWIDIFDDLVNYANRQQSQPLIGLKDAILAGGGAIAGGPLGAAITTGISKASVLPTVKTGVATGAYNIGKLTDVLDKVPVLPSGLRSQIISLFSKEINK